MRRKNAKTNSISRNSRVAKKKPIVERGLGSWCIGAYRWLNFSMFVHDNFDEFKAFLENLFS
jgi:hypothetical protein